MAYIENNSTDIPLGAFQRFTGKSFKPSVDYVTIAISLNIPTSGTLQVLHSFDDVNYFTFGDEYSYTSGSHSHQFSVKANFFKVSFENGSVAQNTFNLNCRILKQISEDFVLNKDFDTITVFPPQTGFLSSEKDSITITGLVSTNLDKCITGNSIQVEIMNQSGLNNVNIFDSFGNSLSSTEGKLDVNATITGQAHLNYTTDSVSIGGTLPALTYARDAVNVSGSSVSVSGSVSVSNMISGFATATNQTSTNTKLDTINTTITNKTNNGLIDSIQIYGSNGITNKPFLQDNYQTLFTNSVDNSINDAPFDLLINGAQLWADSSPAGNPFFADLNGRQGWYYDNFNNVTNVSNIYWYANPPSGSLKENNMAFSSLGSMYAIITCDYVENGELTVPFMGVYSQPTGSGDFIPGFAHSRWVFQLNGDNRAKLRKGETILIYTGSTRPNYHINLPAYPLSLASQSGDCSPLEIIAYMTINTQATTSKIGYLLQYCGYMNSLIGFNREYEFRNSKDRLIQSNLSASRILVDTGLTSLNVDIGITNIAINNFSELNGLNVEISNGLTILNFPSEISINNGLTILNFPSSVEISNGLTILNFPSEISINNGLTILNFPSSVEISNGLTILNFSELAGLSVNTGLTGFALESTLQAIKLKTDLLSAGSTAFGPNIAVSVVNGVLVRSETYSGDGDSISATYNAALNKIGLDTNIVNANPIAITCSNFPSGFKIFDDNNNGLGYGTNPLIIDGTVSFPENSFIGITGAVNVSGTVGITGGVHCMGYDPDTLTYNDMYVDIDGTQRVEVVQPHIVSAKYVIEKDVNIIAKLVANPSTNSNAYSVDTRGREGWLFNNINPSPGVVSGANTLDWYKSSISSPPSLTIRKLQALYAVICFDKLPLNAFHSYYVVTTTESTWFYYNPLTQIPSIYPGETYLLYYGQKAFQHFPEIQNASKLEMIRALNIGPGNLDEVITNIQLLNIDESALNVYSYLISECGIYDQDRQNWFSVYFRNTIDFDASNNLSNLQLDSNNNLKTVSDLYANFGGTRTALICDTSGRLFNVSNTRDGTGNPITSTDTTATSQSLDTAASLYTTDGSTRSALSSTSGSLNTYISNQISGYALDSTLTTTNTKLETGNGYLNTINQGVGYSYITAGAINNVSITAGSTSSFYTWTRGQYGRNSVLVYVDGSTAITDSVSVYSKNPTGGSILLGVFYPVVLGGARRWTINLNLAPFNQLAIYNNSASTISGVSVEIYSA